MGRGAGLAPRQAGLLGQHPAGLPAGRRTVGRFCLEFSRRQPLAIVRFPSPVSLGRAMHCHSATDCTSSTSTVQPLHGQWECIAPWHAGTSQRNWTGKRTIASGSREAAWLRENSKQNRPTVRRPAGSPAGSWPAQPGSPGPSLTNSV